MDTRTVSNLRKEFNNRASPAVLHDLFNKYFGKNAGPATIKDTSACLSAIGSVDAVYLRHE